MPLAFESLSHGTIAFGFFNIDTDQELVTYVWRGGYPLAKSILPETSSQLPGASSRQKASDLQIRKWFAINLNSKSL